MDERIASVIAEAIRYRDGKDYNLIKYCIMPNQVHLIFGIGKHEILDVGHNSILYNVRLIDNLSNRPLSKILQSLKRLTAREANKFLQRTGSF